MEKAEQLFKINDVEQLIEQLSEKLQKSIFLENKQFELIAYRLVNDTSFDSVQEKTILAKRCPLFVIEKLKKEGIITRLVNSSQPIRLQSIEDIDFHGRIGISLTYVEELCGYLWINEESDKLKDSDLSLLEEITPHLAKMLYVKASTTKQNPQQTIWKMINGEFVSDAELHQAAKMDNFQIPKIFKVVIISIKDPQYLPVLKKVRTVFEAEKIAYYLGKGTDIIGIMNDDPDMPFHTKPNAKLEKTMQTITQEEKNILFVGKGSTYQHYNQLRNSYLEALEVIETMFFLNMEQQTKFSIRELGILRYMKSIYKKNVSDQFRHPAITTLMKKDAENNSELIKTLWKFLDNDCKVGLTAERLFIHPNTLNYRIKQMIELTNLDLTDMHEKAEIYVHLLLLKYVPEYKEFYKKIIY